MAERQEQDHGALQEQLTAYLDGELTPDEATTLEQHLDGCPECRALLDELRDAQHAVVGLGREVAPPTFVRDVQRTIAVRSEGRFFRRAIRPRRLGLDFALWTILIVLTSLLLLAIGEGMTSFLLLDEPPVPRGMPVGPAQGWGGDPRGARFLLRLDVREAEARWVLAEVTTQLGLPAGDDSDPRDAGQVLRFGLPAGLVVPFLERLRSRLPLRVERQARATDGGGGGGGEVPLEVRWVR